MDLLSLVLIAVIVSIGQVAVAWMSWKRSDALRAMAGDVLEQERNLYNGLLTKLHEQLVEMRKISIDSLAHTGNLQKLSMLQSFQAQRPGKEKDATIRSPINQQAIGEVPDVPVRGPFGQHKALQRNQSP